MLYDLTRRLTVIIESVVTFATGLAVLITALSGVLIAELPNGWQDTAARWAVGAVTVIATAVAALRRVTPVPAEDRGILPQPPAIGPR